MRIQSKLLIILKDYRINAHIVALKWMVKQLKSKYNAKKVTVDGIRFDSKREAKRYEELKELEAAGVISQLELQPRFELQEGFKYKGRAIRKIEYVADFKYLEMKQGLWVVEDVKGMKTDVYKLKKKLFLYKYGNFFVFMEV